MCLTHIAALALEISGWILQKNFHIFSFQCRTKTGHRISSPADDSASDLLALTPQYTSKDARMVILHRSLPKLFLLTQKTSSVAENSQLESVQGSVSSLIFDSFPSKIFMQTKMVRTNTKPLGQKHAVLKWW